MLVRAGVREQHFLDAVELGGGVGRGLGVLAGDENVHVAAKLLGGGERLAGGILQRLVVVLGQKKRGHPSTPASLSLPTSSAGEATFTPDLRPAGSTVFTSSSHGFASTP